MYNEKIENLLNLSLNATEGEREKSEILTVGYEPETKRWELIVKYHGTLWNLGDSTMEIEYLLCGYAIVTLLESQIKEFSVQEAVEYIEKPKRLYTQITEELIQSGIVPAAFTPNSLTGRGVIVAVIDSGITYARREFRHRDGTTRILRIWDQSIQATPDNGYKPPSGYGVGSEFKQEEINEALVQDSIIEQKKIVPTVDLTGHGTAIALLSSGSEGTQGGFTGVAPQSDLLIVKLASPSTSDFPQTTQLMRALSYVVSCAIEYKQPMVINISFGNTYGAHDGTSLLERYVDAISAMGTISICVGSGNEASSGGHVAGILSQNKVVAEEFSVGSYSLSLNVQVWLHYVDDLELQVISPNGATYGIIWNQLGIVRTNLEDVELLIYTGMPTPYSVKQEVFFDMIPIRNYVTEGIWTIKVVPKRVVNGRYDMYLPSLAVRNSNTRFYLATPEKTLTIPSTASRVITVGAYDTKVDAYAYFSGRGVTLTEEDGTQGTYATKPDLVAPGVGIPIPSDSMGTLSYSGTSYATPFVTGSCTLLMEWGIVQGNDPYLYGEKLKAYLQRGARPLRGYESYPNSEVGYGKLDLFNTFENIRRL
ncbi:MAG: S8 family peptidase [Eubacteriales bacterium]